MDRDMIVCTETELVVVVPIADLPGRPRAALTLWLLEHGVDPQELALGHPVERDPYASTLRWRINSARGREIVTVYSPAPRGSWPPPFPTTWPPQSWLPDPVRQSGTCRLTGP